MCDNGELNDACVCTCDLGWTGAACDTSWCNISISTSHRSVWAQNFTTTLSNKQWLIHDGATMIGASRSEHATYIVLDGGNLSCYPMRPDSYGVHNTFYVQEGGTLDTNCLGRSAQYVKLMYETGANILWPYPDYNPAQGERQTRNASGVFPLGVQTRYKRTTPCPELEDGEALMLRNYGERCELHCFHGGHPDAECTTCRECDHNLWNTTDQCRTCRDDMCDNGELNDACVCTCDLGWTGAACDTSWCNISISTSHRSVWAQNFTTTLSNKQWLIHDGATMIGASRSEHATYIVLDGGNLSCYPMRPDSYGVHNTFYVQEGGTLDTNCLGRSAQYVKLMYETGANILWPYPDYNPAQGERQTRNASGVFPLGVQTRYKRTTPCPYSTLMIRGLTRHGDCLLNCGNGGTPDASCQRCENCTRGYDPLSMCHGCVATTHLMVDGTCVLRTAAPTRSPNPMPTSSPSGSPSALPSTSNPTATPTRLPSTPPTTSAPTESPTAMPTPSPTGSPTVSAPTASPTESPTAAEPTVSPTASPTMQPTLPPTELPTTQPSMVPTPSPDEASGSAAFGSDPSSPIFIMTIAIVVLVLIVAAMVVADRSLWSKVQQPGGGRAPPREVEAFSNPMYDNRGVTVGVGAFETPVYDTRVGNTPAGYMDVAPEIANGAGCTDVAPFAGAGYTDVAPFAGQVLTFMDDDDRLEALL